jgi:S-methylmethionine-dependent homocysteine/selenocysteine methylase
VSDFILLDGGMGRELARIGAPFRQPEWSALALIEGAEFVTRAHAAFIEAGSQVITTNSYAINPFHIGADRFASIGVNLADLAGRLAREAARERILVAGSLPPVCGSYRPDLFTREAAEPILRDLIAGLSPHVDLWLGETLGSLAEARLIAELLPKDERELWFSFTVDDEDGTRLRSGESVVDAARLAESLGASALLFNCSQPEAMAAALEAVVGFDLPRGAYANAFPPQTDDEPANETLHDIRADLTPEAYVGFAKRWLELGATLIGGCCGIGPRHIAALAALQNGSAAMRLSR